MVQVLPIRSRKGRYVRARFELALQYIHFHKVGALQELLRDYPAVAMHTSLPDNDGFRQNLLHYVCEFSNEDFRDSHLKITSILLEKGIAVDAPTRPKFGETPLHLAIKAQNKELIQLLLSKGASLQLWGRFHHPFADAMGYALFYDAGTTIAEILLRKGAALPLPYAAAMGHLHRCQSRLRTDHSLFLQKSEKAMQSLVNYSLLFACLHGHLAVCEYLLHNGADANACLPFFEHCACPLHIACLHQDRPEIIQLLLQKGADPKLVDQIQGLSPTGWAMSLGREGSFELLRNAF